jgi:hypothetical protein
MYKRIFHSLALITLLTAGYSIPASSQDANQEACNTCKKGLIDARWTLRQQCLAVQGATEDSCNGPKEGNTCCNCTKSPQEDPACWNEACERECNWAQKCASSCQTQTKLPDGAACQIYSDCQSNFCVDSKCINCTEKCNSDCQIRTSTATERCNAAAAPEDRAVCINAEQDMGRCQRNCIGVCSGKGQNVQG